MKDIYEVLRQKERQLAELRKEVEALRVTYSLVIEEADCYTSPEMEIVPMESLPSTEENPLDSVRKSLEKAGLLNSVKGEVKDGFKNAGTWLIDITKKDKNK